MSKIHEIAPLTEAERELVERNLHVAKIAAKQACKGKNGYVTYSEAFSSASYGMIRAVKRFDKSRAGFGTSSTPRARGQISDDLRLRSRWFFYGPAKSKMAMGSLDATTSAEGFDKDSSVGRSLQSNDPPIGSRMESVDEVERLIEPLTPREKKVMRMFFLEGETLRSIAGKLGLSECRLSQIKTDALEKLRLHHTKEKQDGNSHK